MFNQSFKIKDLPIELIDGDRSYRYPKRDELTDEGKYIFPSTTNIDDGRIITKDAKYVTKEKYDQIQKGRFDKNDIIITTRGTIGNLAYIKSSEIRGLINAQMLIIRANEEFVDTEYLYYQLKSDIFQKQLKNFASGSAQPQIPKRDLREIEILNPDIKSQKKIASILSTFDDLIENNSRRIAILEEMARRIYREWFVHFRFPSAQGRLRSKVITTGRYGEQAIPADDGPKLVDSGTELGEIPEGWEVKKLEDVADINPENISTDYKGEIEYINISGVNEGSIDETEMHEFEEAPGRAKRSVKHGDIIWSSVRPNLKAYALILNPPSNQIASTGFAVIRPKKLPASFLYNFSTTEYFVQYLVNHTRGSAYPAVNVSDFKNAPILVPDDKLVEKFHQATWSNFLQIDKFNRKNKKLKETRDLLLPKLISGRLNVEFVK